MSRTYLVIGGPWDGTFTTTESSFVRVPLLEDSVISFGVENDINIRAVEYQRVTIVTENGVRFVYVAPDVENVIDALIAGYRVKVGS